MLRIVSVGRKPTFRLLAALSLALFVMALVATSQPAQAQTDNTPWLSVVGNQIKDPSGNTVILRGVSLIDPGVMNQHGTIANTQAMIDKAASWNAHVMRIPVYPGPIDGSPGWVANPDSYYNNLLLPAVNACAAKGAYCIIDWHYISDYNIAAVQTNTQNFWNYIAPRFKTNNNVIFELFNEPINPDDWNTWQSVAQPWVNLIRNTHGATNLLLIGGPKWSQKLQDADTDPFTGSNIAYVAHIYPCHGTTACNPEFTSRQQAWDTWFGHATPVRPFFITEWGYQLNGAVPTGGTGATTSVFGNQFMSYMDAKGVSWTAWTFDAYWQPIMFEPGTWNIMGGDNYMGQFTKDTLYAKRCLNQPNNYCPSGGGVPTNTPVPSVPTNTPVPSGTSARFKSYNFQTYYIRHQSYRGRIDPNVSPIQDSQFKVVAGLANSGAISFESVNFPGRFLRRRSNGEVWLDANDGTQTFKNEATWYRRAGLASSTWSSFESYAAAGQYMRHSAYVLYANTISTATDKSDATFLQE